MEDCNIALDLFLKALTPIAAAGAAFLGATATHFYTRYRQNRDDDTRYASLAAAMVLDLEFQIHDTSSLHTELKNVRQELGDFIQGTRTIRHIPFLNFVSRAASFSDVKKALLNFRGNAELYAWLSKLEAWTLSIAKTINDEYNERVVKFAENSDRKRGKHLASELGLNVTRMIQALDAYLIFMNKAKAVAEAEFELSTGRKLYQP